jgi:hypothetical protein
MARDVRVRAAETWATGGWAVRYWANETGRWALVERRESVFGWPADRPISWRLTRSDGRVIAGECAAAFLHRLACEFVASGR